MNSNGNIHSHRHRCSVDDGNDDDEGEGRGSGGARRPRTPLHHHHHENENECDDGDEKTESLNHEKKRLSMSKINQTKRFINSFIDSNGAIAFMSLLTVYALYSDDVRIVAFPPMLTSSFWLFRQWHLSSFYLKYYYSVGAKVATCNDLISTQCGTFVACMLGIIEGPQWSGYPRFGMCCSLVAFIFG
jgi:hypothetical protein